MTNEETFRPVLQHLRDRQLKQNKNTLACILGDTGSGKSLAGLTWCSRIDPTFNIDRVVFKAADFFKLANSDLPPGSAIMWDEVGIDFDSRDFMSKLNKMISYLLQIFRHRNYFIVFTVPHLGFIDTRGRSLFHVLMSMDKVDKARGIATARFWFVKANHLTGKWFRIRARVLIDGHRKRLDILEIPLPPKELHDAYELKHTAFKNSLAKELERDIKADKEKKFNKYLKDIGLPGCVGKLNPDNFGF